MHCLFQTLWQFNGLQILWLKQPITLTLFFLNHRSGYYPAELSAWIAFIFWRFLKWCRAHSWISDSWVYEAAKNISILQSFCAEKFPFLCANHEGNQTNVCFLHLSGAHYSKVQIFTSMFTCLAPMLLLEQQRISFWHTSPAFMIPDTCNRMLTTCRCSGGNLLLTLNGVQLGPIWLIGSHLNPLVNDCLYAGIVHFKSFGDLFISFARWSGSHKAWELFRPDTWRAKRTAGADATGSMCLVCVNHQSAEPACLWTVGGNWREPTQTHLKEPFRLELKYLQET